MEKDGFSRALEGLTESRCGHSDACFERNEVIFVEGRFFAQETEVGTHTGIRDIAREPVMGAICRRIDRKHMESMAADLRLQGAAP